MTELKVNLQGSWKRILAMITVAAMCFTVIYVSPASAASKDSVEVNFITASDAQKAKVTLEKSEIEVSATTTAKVALDVVTSVEVTTAEQVAEKTTWRVEGDAATVDKNGVVRGVSPGEATIIASYNNDAVTAGEVIKVTPKSTDIAVTGITLDKTTLNLEVGKTDKLTATVAPENATDKAVAWTSSNEKAATVAQDGTVKAVAAGKATITAKAGNKTATCAVTVKEKTVTPVPDNKTPDSNTVGTTKKPAKATVTLNATKLTMKKGTSTKALKVKKASVKGDKIKAVKTSNKKVVAVTKKGQTITLKAKKTGKATITVTMNSGAKATVKVTVNNKKVVTKKLTMSKKTAKVKKGKKLTLTVTRNPINATEKITWKSSNKKIATVKNGKVTVKKNAKAGKKVTITARTTNGKKATCKITVKK